MTDQCCVRPGEPALSQGDAERLAAALKAVADPARLRLLDLIAGAGEICACDLVDPIGLSQPTVSHHLKVLYESGFLDRERRGRWIYYRVVPERLDEVVASWSDGIRVHNHAS